MYNLMSFNRFYRYTNMYMYTRLWHSICETTSVINIQYISVTQKFPFPICSLSLHPLSAPGSMICFLCQRLAYTF